MGWIEIWKLDARGFWEERKSWSIAAPCMMGAHGAQWAALRVRRLSCPEARFIQRKCKPLAQHVHHFFFFPFFAALAAAAASFALRSSSSATACINENAKGGCGGTGTAGERWSTHAV